MTFILWCNRWLPFAEIVIIVYLFYFIHRVRRISEFSHLLMRQVFRATAGDMVFALRHGWLPTAEGSEWRWDALSAVSFDEMLWKFWKPLDSFYPDYSFIKDPMEHEQ